MKTILYLGLLLFIAGCADPMTVTKHKGEGSKRTYQADFDTVWKAVHLICTANGYHTIKIEKSSGTYIVRVPARAESWGENVGLFVTKLNDNSTQVEVVSKIAGPHALFAYDWEEPLLAQLQLALNNPQTFQADEVSDFTKPKPMNSPTSSPKTFASPK